MRIHKLGVAALALIGTVSLGGCAEDMYGPYGYGGGYAPYGGVSVGVGYGGGYGYGYGAPYGYGGYYGEPFGWYDDFYYPGTGIYVYDSYRRPRMWNDNERRYWSQRSGGWSHNGGGHSGGWSHNGTATTNGNRPAQQNWSGFNRRPHH